MDHEELTQETIDQFVIASHHDLPRVQHDLTRHPDLLNESASWVETPIQAASHVANRPIAEFLLGQGAPLDICGAAMLGMKDEVEAFLNDDPDLVNATGAHEIPLMFHAAIGGSREIIELLLARGANVNAGMEDEKSTALHGAAGFGFPDLVRYLLDQGADFTAKDHEGRTPLDVAEQTGHEAIATMLRDYMENAPLDGA